MPANFDRLITAARQAISPSPQPDAAPTVCMVYIHVPGDAEHLTLTRRFVESYLRCPPGYPHRTIVVTQGRMPDKDMRQLLMKLPGCTFYQHDDSGWDIGGYIAVSRIISEDIGVYFCGTAFVQHVGWLKRMVDVWQKHGPGFYGSLGTYEISPHINTTGFFCPPALLAEYPHVVRTKADRYALEHGPVDRCLWKRCLRDGIKVRIATWDGVYEWWDWRKPPNVYRRGDQSNCITFFRHSSNFGAANPKTREFMSKLADTLTDPEFIKLKSALTNKQ